MPFEWDEAKRENNLAKHGVDFRRAAQVFRGRVVERLDQRRNYGEIRIRCVGEIDGRAYVVLCCHLHLARPEPAHHQRKESQ
jgi:uncharacterized protein